MTATIKSADYTPGIVPDDGQEFRRFIQTEFLAISEAIKRLSDGHLDPQSVAPTKPREGDIRYADGTNWNPGCGEGVYAYINDEWEKMSNDLTYSVPGSYDLLGDDDGAYGTVEAGTVAGVQAWNDGVELHIGEVSGVPGFDVRFNFTGISHIRYISTNIKYEGSVSHDVELQIYNYTDVGWETLTHIGSADAYNTRFVSLPTDDADYISSGAAILRAYHVSNGTPSHDIHFDYISLVC